MHYFDRQAAWVRMFDMEAPPIDALSRWASHGISVVSLQAFDPGGQVDQTKLLRWVDAAIQSGLEITLWGSCSDPEQDVIHFAAVRDAIVAHGAPVRGMIAEVERYVTPDGSDTRSADFVSAFRATSHFKWMPLACCVQGNCAATMDSKKGLDYSAWINGRAFLMPECYWNQSENYDPVPCITLQHGQGWPYSLIFPVLGCWGDAGNGDRRPFEYLERMASPYVPTQGIGWYSGVSLNDLDLRVTAIIQKMGWTA